MKAGLRREIYWFNRKWNRKINIGGSNSDYSYIYHTYKDVDDKAMSGDITMNTVNTYILEMASVTGKLSVRSN